MGRVRIDAMRYISPSGYRWRLRFHLGKRDEVQRSFTTLEEAIEARDNALRRVSNKEQTGGQQTREEVQTL